MSLTIHHLHIAQSERIVWLCEELGIPYTLKTYTRDPIFAPPDLAALTPQKSAPVMTTTNAVTGAEFNMSESGAIAAYIDGVFGGNKLSLGPEHENYADFLFWFHYANSSLSGAFFRLLTAALLKPAPDNPFRKTLGAGLHKHLAALDARLAVTNAFLAGDQLTLADIMTVWSLTNGRQWNPTDLSPYPAILAYLQRIGAREAYQRAMEKAEPGLDWRQGLTAQGPDVFPPFRQMLSQMGVDLAQLKN
ncbi:uncharacterized protein Z520_12057 [Fonsecaea multimorphosa CBS 102226]|uniref:Glutathione S-transferase n=1 Tax=Fonsecaea multimorphosa CBS 102226 TaxID=1442371 RepID=A0A0D2I4G4_9EURO|nr:uncharacterized protein Z520_12057 [Fonsecaea multimorphosa CBS 102226]KIX92176.1 hypothetical protein Z520_12057 [Fonsecaea multimorphosa CBS 102226]OAL17609.1 hypothetical protein AYO22_11471 [Fonsecaea multimorphosa]